MHARPDNAVRGHAAGAEARRPGGGFTLIELLVVIVIIVLILAAVVPSVESMWAQRRLSETETTLRGALVAARQRAIGGKESGLLFFVDPAGVQRVFPIEQEDEPVSMRARYLPPLRSNARIDLLSANRFRILQGGALRFPPPMRAVPRTVVLADRPPPDSFDRYSDVELANENFVSPQGAVDPGQRHRNFFTIIFSTRGQLVVGRDVLIFDEDTQANLGNPPGRGLGDLTGLPVANVSEFLPQRDAQPRPIYPLAGNLQLVHLIAVDQPPVAANFPSVDGVMVYDDALYRRSGDRSVRRAFLARQGRPYYVSRVTGDVIRGPLGENEDPKG